MGCVRSLLARRDAGPSRVIHRDTYYTRHPGLHNPSIASIESEIVRSVRTPDLAAVDVLQVKQLDLDIKNNCIAHHTNEFDITDANVFDSREVLVIRRGQDVSVKIEFNRQYDPAKDDLRFVFQFGIRPLPSKGSHVEFMLSDKDTPKEWGAYITATDNNVLSITLTTPVNCYVGKWKVKVDVVKRDDVSINVYRYAHKDPIYILFNPWCKDDQVYMPDENLLTEYILNETGKIYSGNYRQVTSKPWVFGQFTGDVLDCACYLLNKSSMSDQSRGNATIIARKISSLVNSADDAGVLVGNWSGDYTGGTSPLQWTGSVGILDEFYKTKQPVKFGQCWVFSGVVTTVCRALGIPARSVTNYASAHDTDGSITIDVHYDAEGKPLTELDNDSIWNFHVWNDVWMARPDLPNGYGGWQAIDATPQETSEGVFCVGPVPVLAIKRGEVNLPYDGPFVFAECNADRVYWAMDKEGTMKVARVHESSVGRCILTKRAQGRSSWRGTTDGSDADKEDITDQYKFKEGTGEERVAVRRANLYSSKVGMYQTKSEDVKFDLVANPDTFVGQDMDISLRLMNISDNNRTVNGTIVVSSMYYTGVCYKQVFSRTIGSVSLAPNEETSVDMKVDVNDYLSKLIDHCICQISCMCIVDETKQIHVECEDLRLRKPHLTIQAPDTANIGKTFRVSVSFENPLPVTLTECELRVEGPGLQRPTILKQPNINAKQPFSASFDMTPVKIGTREIVVYFNCVQMSSVTVSHTVNTIDESIHL